MIGLIAMASTTPNSVTSGMTAYSSVCSTMSSVNFWLRYCEPYSARKSNISPAADRPLSTPLLSLLLLHIPMTGFGRAIQPRILGSSLFYKLFLLALRTRPIEILPPRHARSFSNLLRCPLSSALLHLCLSGRSLRKSGMAHQNFQLYNQGKGAISKCGVCSILQRRHQSFRDNIQVVWAREIDRLYNDTSG